jgi:hypothetical protein
MNQGSGNGGIGRKLWMVVRPIAAVAIAAGITYAFRASEDIGVAALMVAVGLGLLALWIDHRLLNRRRSHRS